jgi:putative DNA primase/helicase
MTTILDAAAGRWPELLQIIGGLTPQQLTDEHQPCPACGGTDRYRWDNDDGPGGCYCNQCGGKSGTGGAMSGIDLLMRLRGWTFAQASTHVAEYLGIATDAAAKPRKPKRPARAPDVPPPGTPPPALGRAVAQYPYGPDPAEPWFWIQRIPQPPKHEGGKPEKIFVHRTWIDGQWHWPSKRDPFTSEWPAPRPLYRLPELIARPDAPVVICEGEKSADAGTPLLPDHVVIAWCGGTGGVATVDWSPLAGRTVTLWPDADDAGRIAMAKLAPRLLQLGCTVAIVNPPPEAPSGWDLADAPAAGWTDRHAAAALRRLAVPVALPPEPEPEPAPPPVPQTIDLPDGAPFTCLGFDGDGYYYQPGSTGQVIRLSASGHTSTGLLRLAKLSYWETIYPTKTGVNWQAAISSLFERQAAQGIYSPDRIRGRGAWWDAGRSVLHLGDRLIVDGQVHPVAHPPPSRFNYQRLASIDISDDLKPLDNHRGTEILDIACRFHWEVPASGLLLAGWAALAPICGSLGWRPHVWLTASAGSGKSALLERFLGPLLDSLALWPEGNTTEAFIRQELRADALPVIMDEAESNEAADRKRIQDILALARVASSSSRRGVIGKGGADGQAQRFTIRSMFLLCSISTALKQGADASRFSQLTMRNPSFLPKPERIAHWNALDRDLTSVITAETGHRLALRSVQQIPVIRESVAVFRRAAADRFDSQRHGDQYGTLLAGAWSLMESRPPTEADAFRLIDGNDWTEYREASEQPDEERCLQTILQHQLRVEGDRGGYTRTIWELIELAVGRTAVMEISPGAAEAQLGRLGLKADGDRLIVSSTALGVRKILDDTAWVHSWATVLKRLPGATAAGVTRFRGLGTNSRAVSLPLPRA